MHIETELDSQHSDQLIRLQRRINRPLPEVVADLLASALDQTSEEIEGEKALRILRETGLLGCMKGDGDLSVDYKRHLWQPNE